MSEECVIDLEADYDLAWHIGSVFIIMAFSFMGTTIPFVFKKYFSMSSLIFQSAKLLGAGVILSTAFNHMLTAAFENLVSPCSGIDFPALAGVCALMGVLFTLVVQLIASETLSALVAKKGGKSTPTLNYDQVKSNNITIIKDYTAHEEHPDCIAGLEIVEIGESAAQDDSCAKEHDKAEDRLDSGHDHSHGGVISHSNRVTAYLLELGIAVHSIIIGIALGVAREEFRSLFIALVFHQFFEGIGLSSVVSEADFKMKWIAVGLVAFCKLNGNNIRHCLNSNWSGDWDWNS